MSSFRKRFSLGFFKKPDQCPPTKPVCGSDNPVEALWKEWYPALASARAEVHVSTDKPVYRPGETVYIRAVAFPLDNCPESYKGVASLGGWRLEIISPKKAKVANGQNPTIENGVMSFQWLIPQDISGGDYVLKVQNDLWNHFIPSASRKIQVRAFRNPKLSVKLDFLGSGYGPGDKVRSKVTVSSFAHGLLPAGTPVRASVILDGQSLFPEPVASELDMIGEAVVEFELPSHMQEGIGTLTAVVNHGGDVESGSKTIPIVLQNLDISLYPEGGPLVESVPNRVYFESLTPTEEPVELEAELWVRGPTGSQKLLSFAAEHEGRGSFQVTPLPGHSYEVRVTKPAGILRSIPLPKTEKRALVKGDDLGPLVAMEAQETSRKGSGDPVTVSLTSNGDVEVVVGLFFKEKAMDSVELSLKAGQRAEASLKPTLGGFHKGGVLRVTAASKKHGIPIAERLVFVLPREELTVTVAPAEASQKEGSISHVSSFPGASQAFDVTVKDSEGNFLEGAVVGVTVVDRSALEMVERRKQAPRLLEMALLESEVDHFEDAGAYLGTGYSSRKVDLLLGTQGWRRFAYRSPLESLQVSTPGYPYGPSGDESPGKEDVREGFERAMGIALAGKSAPGSEGYSGISLPRGPMMMAFGAMRQRAMVPGALPLPQAAMAAQRMPEPVGGAVGTVGELEAFPMDDGMAEAAAIEQPMAVDEVETGAVLAAKPMLAMAEHARVALPLLDVLPAPARLMRKKVHAGYLFEDEGSSSVRFERVYAHKRAGEGPGPRRDFTETVFWAAALQTNKEGVVRIEFQLSDSITSFAVLADAHTWAQPAQRSSNSASKAVPWPAMGGNQELVIQSQKPLSVDAKLPLQLTAGDIMTVPISVKSSVPFGLNLTLSLTLHGCLHSSAPDLSRVGQGARLAPEASTRFLLPATADPAASEPSDDLSVDGALKSTVRVELQGSPEEASRKLPLPNLPALRDSVERSLAVFPSGFPGQLSFAGIVGPTKPANTALPLPAAMVPGSAVLEVSLFVSPSSQLSQAVEALIQEPYGCFEQTSATVYPNIMAQKYFKAHPPSDSSPVQRSRDLLQKGLQRLLSFEVPGGGFEWFGQSPSHEALSAYGLMELTDMAQVYPVPQEVLARTRAWLMKRKDDPKRSFVLNPMNLDTFGGAPADITLAYIVWALTSAGETQGLGPQLSQLTHQASQPKSDPYFTALVALSLLTLGDTAQAEPLAASLAKTTGVPSDQSLEVFSVPGASTSITSSRGKSLLVETTSLAALTWLQLAAVKEPEDRGVWVDRCQGAIEWILSQSEGGSFGSTQGTVLALKAILAFDDLRKSSSVQSGTVKLSLGGSQVKSVLISPADTEVKKLVLRPTAPSPGSAMDLKLEMEDGFSLPFAAMLRYRTALPASSPECAVSLSTRLASADLSEADMAAIHVELTNQHNRPLGMVLAIIGVPSGLEVRYEQLQDMVTRGTIPFFEIRGRDVILYWRTLKAKQVVSFVLEASSAIPGKYTGPASRAYEYYASEYKSWVAPLVCNIREKE